MNLQNKLWLTGFLRHIQFQTKNCSICSILRRHEVALHIATDPYREWKILENETKRTMKYYTIHGTSRVIAQFLWGRKIGEKQAKIPSGFPIKIFS